MRKKLRFGVMCTGEQLESAFAASIDELLAIDGVDLALLIVEANPPARRSLRAKLWDLCSLNGNLWAIVQRLVPRERLPCYRPRDMSAVFAGVPRIRSEDVERIRRYDLDFILRLEFGIISGDMLNAARYGVWSFQHGGASKFRGRPPAFWEIYHGEATTGASLQKLIDRPDAGVILQRCHIQSRHWSYTENLNAIVWAAAHMPARVCRDILAGHAQYLEAAPSRAQAPVFSPPTDLQMARFLIKTWSAWAKRQVEGVLLVEDWNVGMVHGPVEAFLRPDFRPAIQWLADTKEHTFRADPFVHSIGPDEKKLLVEEFDYTVDRGVIVEMDLDANGVARSSPRPAIDNGMHMSYPYPIEHEGRVYCVPESWQSRSVRLYAFDRRRRQWHVVAPIIEDFAAVDPTIVQHGLWWLWCTNAEDEPDSKLFLWYAVDLLGPWRPHPGNPVKVDVRSSRPAGKPFLFEGSLYRPAQDCSRTYGGGITISRITRLSLAEFCEEPVAHIEPWDRRYRRGIHTLAGDGSLTVLDGKRMVMAPDLVRRLAHKMTRLAQACGRRSLGCARAGA